MQVNENRGINQLLGNNSDVGNKEGDDGRDNQPHELSDEAQEAVERYRTAYRRWGAPADAVDKGQVLQAMTTSRRNTTQKPQFIEHSPRQAVAAFFAPIVNLCKLVANFFTSIVAKQGYFPLLEARTSENFYKSIDSIFDGEIPKPVLRSMHTHRNGWSWCTLTNLDIKRVMTTVKASLHADYGITEQDFERVENEEKGKSRAVYTTRKPLPVWEKRTGGDVEIELVPDDDDEGDSDE